MGPANEAGPEPDEGSQGRYRGLGLLGMGWVVVASLLICMVAGWQIDRWLGTAPWFFIGLLLLGVVAGFVELIRMALRYSR
jgi:ATP synthase protein I